LCGTHTTGGSWCKSSSNPMFTRSAKIGFHRRLRERRAKKRAGGCIVAGAKLVGSRLRSATRRLQRLLSFAAVPSRPASVRRPTCFGSETSTYTKASKTREPARDFVGPRCVFLCVSVCLFVFVCVRSRRCLVGRPSHLCVCRVGTPPRRVNKYNISSWYSKWGNFQGAGLIRGRKMRAKSRTVVIE